MLLISVGFIVPPTLLAVSFDGDSGTASTGSNLIQAKIPKLIKTSVHVAFDFASYLGVGSLEDNKDINISMNYPTSYRVVATGDGAGGAFIIGSSSSAISYSVFFNDKTGEVGKVAMSPGVALSGQTGGVMPISNTTKNANISVLIPEIDMLGADAGVYEEHVIFTVTPE